MSFLYWLLLILTPIIILKIRKLSKKFKNTDTIFATIETRLQASKRSSLAEAIRNMAKVLTIDDEKDEQIEWLNKAKGIIKESHSIILREICLIEQRERLKKRLLQQDLSLEESQMLDNIEREIEDIYVWYGIVYEEYNEHTQYCPTGAWIREYQAQTSHGWRQQVDECRATGGCCSRSCQCCSKARIGITGHRGHLSLGIKMHCTPGCGCCIRWKGFYEPDEKERRDREWDANFSVAKICKERIVPMMS